MNRHQLLAERLRLVKLIDADDGTHELQRENLPLDLAEVERRLADMPREAERPPLARRRWDGRLGRG